MKITGRYLFAVLAGIFISVGSLASARAGVIITVDQVGSDVVATGSGTLNLSGLSYFSSQTVGALIDAQTGTVILGNQAVVDYYTGASGPISFGGGFFALANSHSGGIFGIQANSGLGPLLFVPQGYGSNDPLGLSTATWDNSTLASLGLTNGTYVWAWNNVAGAPADTFTVQIGPTAVPEPVTLSLFGVGVAGAFAARRRKRRS